MTRKTTPLRQDLFQRRRVRDLSQPAEGNRPVRSWKGVNMFYMALSILLQVTGAVAILAGLTGQFSIAWLPTGLIILGSLAMPGGFFLMLETVRERKSIDNLVKKAIMRSINDNS